MLPDPELLPLSGKDLPRLLELRRKSYFKIKRTYVRRDVQYARAVGNRKEKCQELLTAKINSMFYGGERNLKPTTQILVSDLRQRIGESTLEGYQNKLHSKGGKCMYTKSLVFGIAMLISFLPARSYAQSGTAGSPVEEINTSDIPNGSIVVISKEESDNPGYAHTKYAFVDQACAGARVVDYYGPPVDLNDKDLQQVEQRMCTEVAMDTRNGD